MKIIIGKSGVHNIYLDLDICVTTRLLVTADSGGGKTVLLKRLCEQIFGKIPILIIDPEGEFAPLREKFGFVLVGPGGETPADPRSAALVAQTLLKLKASAVCDIYEMKPSVRHEFVRNFCDGLIDAPKTLWHPTIVIVDEAHMFCPEGKAGESIATDAVKSLSTRGRKRGICPIFATQRLAEFNKGASSMCLNRLVGGTFEDVNQKRALDVLSVTNEDKHRILAEMKLLEPGYFYALGRAICKERTLLYVGPIETPHGQTALKYASEPPPPPAEIAKMLPKLADLPRAAEEKAKTEAELRAEIKNLKIQVRKAAIEEPIAVSAKPAAAKSISMTADRLNEVLQPIFREYHEQAADKLTAWVDKLKNFLNTAPIVKIDWMPHLRRAAITLNKLSDAEIQNKESHSQVAVQNPKRDTAIAYPRPIENENGDLVGPQRRILKALAELESIGKPEAPREMVAAWSHYSPISSAFTNPLSSLNNQFKYICYPNPGMVALTNEGRKQAGSYPAPDQDEIHRRVQDILDGPKRKIITVFLECSPDVELSREDLAKKSGYSATSSAFTNPLSALHSAGFVEYPKKGWVKASAWLFID